MRFRFDRWHSLNMLHSLEITSNYHRSSQVGKRNLMAWGSVSSKDLLRKEVCHFGLIRPCISFPLTLTQLYLVVPSIMLDVQYRMHPSISRFPSLEFYNFSLQDGTVDSAGNI